MLLTASRILPNGYCVSQESRDGKAYLIPYCLPGETVDVKVSGASPRGFMTELLGVISPSPARAEPFCPYYMVCGGCNLMHVSYEEEKSLKHAILKNALSAHGIEPPDIQIVSGTNRGYRARIQLQDGGFYMKRSRRPVGISACPCATDEINSYLESTPCAVRPRGRVHVFGSVRLKGYPKVVVAEEPLETSPGQGAAHSKRLRIKRGTTSRYEGTALGAQSQCEIDILGKPLVFDILGFFQSNIELLEKTILLATEGLSGKNILDMYAGCGTFSVFLSQSFENIVTVEHNKNAAAFCAANLGSAPHRCYALSGDRWVRYHATDCERDFGAFDVVFIDPPRSGMESAVREWIAKSRIPRVVSLSCDVVTHARDISHLVNAGYKLKRLYLLDYYPRTSNIESLACLEL